MVIILVPNKYVVKHLKQVVTYYNNNINDGSISDFDSTDSTQNNRYQE